MSTVDSNASDSTSEGSPVPPKKRGVPEGLWLKCPGCGASVYKKEVEQRLNVCAKCEHHFYVSAKDRIAQVLDDGTFEQLFENLQPTDPLTFLGVTDPFIIYAISSATYHSDPCERPTEQDISRPIRDVEIT